jgi:trans-2,3-dihydro-3-hydroxyanthranilate isomerase
MSSHPFYILDVFAESKYAGNQLGVVLNAADLSEGAMQDIARETNFSETTFVLSEEPRDGGFDVRIFTPAAEVPFAGHPTLGTAWLIRRELLCDGPDEVTLNLGVGPIRVTFEPDDQGVERAWLHQKEPDFGEAFDIGAIAELFGIGTGDIDDRFPIQTVSMGIKFVVVPLRSLAALKRATFSGERLRRLGIPDLPGLQHLFCSEAYADESDLCVRMFGEAYGVPEDPATGSAAACLTGYLLRHGYFGDGAVDVRIEQGMEIGRPSLLLAKGEKAGGGMRISVGGRVLMTARGELV